MSNLPLNWCSAALSELCFRIVDGSHNPPKGVASGYAMLSARNVIDHQILFDDFRYISAEDFEAENARTQIAPGDVLLTIVGTIGRTAVVPEQTQPFALQRSVAVLKPAQIDGRYLAYAFDEPLQQQWLLDSAKGTAQKGVYLKTLGTAQISLAPLAEQTRIIEKLEELLPDLDAGVAELKAAQRKLAQYRQSLLKAAVEGALTADWRTARYSYDNPPRSSSPRKRGSTGLAYQGVMDSRFRGNDSQSETGADLLQRILTERRARWEARQLAKFAEQGKTPPKDWQAKYPEPFAPDTTGLPELPDGWVWSTLDQLTEFITSGSRGWANYYANHGATFIRSQNINKDWLDLADIAYVNPPRNSEGARTRVRSGDLLLTITGANVGKTARVDVELEEAYVSQHVALMRPVDTKLSDYLHLYLTAIAGGRGQLNEEAYGAGKPGLNLQQVAAVCIPLPGNLELANLLEEIATQLDAATAQHDVIEHALKQSAAQRKNILKAAFAGQLVPQDPNDEPASVLLERIRAERAQLPTARGVRRTGSNRAPATSSPNQSKRGLKSRITA